MSCPIGFVLFDGLFVIDCGLLGGEYVGFYFGLFAYVGYFFYSLCNICFVMGDGGYIDVWDGLETCNAFLLCPLRMWLGICDAYGFLDAMMDFKLSFPCFCCFLDRIPP